VGNNGKVAPLLDGLGKFRRSGDGHSGKKRAVRMDLPNKRKEFYNNAKCPRLTIWFRIQVKIDKEIGMIISYLALIQRG
jgi:hypothetical protein